MESHIRAMSCQLSQLAKGWLLALSIDLMEQVLLRELLLHWLGFGIYKPW